MVSLSTFTDPFKVHFGVCRTCTACCLLTKIPAGRLLFAHWKVMDDGCRETELVSSSLLSGVWGVGGGEAAAASTDDSKLSKPPPPPPPPPRHPTARAADQITRAAIWLPEQNCCLHGGAPSLAEQKCEGSSIRA